MFQRLAMKLRQFMLGRRGLDNLGIALLVSYLVVGFLMNFFRYSAAIYFSLWLVSLVFLAFFLIRFLSRDVRRREQENRKFQGFYKRMKSRFRDRKTHLFFKCPACRNTLRVPRGRGNITVTCPVCREQIRKRT